MAFNVGSFVENVVDAVGAGDALLAYSTLIYLKTKSLVLGIIEALLQVLHVRLMAIYLLKNHKF